VQHPRLGALDLDQNKRVKAESTSTPELRLFMATGGLDGLSLPCKFWKIMDVQSIKVACSSCNLRELCIPMGLNPDEMDKLDHVISSRRRIKRGSALFNTGDKFTSLFAVRSGFFKTCVTTADGRDQVTGFQMTGEIIGKVTFQKDCQPRLPSRWPSELREWPDGARLFANCPPWKRLAAPR